jgi:hypothetical protein
MECLKILYIYIYMNLDYLKFTRLQLIFFIIIIRFENSRYIQYFKVELHVIKSFHLQKLLENNL